MFLGQKIIVVDSQPTTMTLHFHRAQEANVVTPEVAAIFGAATVVRSGTYVSVTVAKRNTRKLTKLLAAAGFEVVLRAWPVGGRGDNARTTTERRAVRTVGAQEAA